MGLRWRRAAGGLIVSLALMASACVTTKPRSRVPSADVWVLDGLPVYPFKIQECAAGALSAVLTYLGDPIGQAELQAELPKAANGGVLSLDLLLAARARGHASELVTGSFERIDQVLAEGLPVILMLRVLDAPGRSRDLYHYILVDGIDRQKRLLRVHFGDGELRWVRARSLDRAWEGAGRALLVVRPVEGRGLSQAAALRQAVALEQAQRFEEAAIAYRNLLQEQPQSALLWTNLGNAEMQAGRASAAEACYRHALELDPSHTDALNNLAWLLLEQGSLEEAERLARSAVDSGSADRHFALETLGRVLRAQGSCEEAIEVYSRGLEQAPRSAPQRGWLWLGLGLSQRDCELPGQAAVSLQQAEAEGAGTDAAPLARTALGALKAPHR